jgi:hypothetical protein
MKREMKNTSHHTTTLILLLLAVCSYGQKVEFGYDAAGNRITRTYIGPPKIALNNPTQSETDVSDIPKEVEKQEPTELEPKDQIVVYPNPPKGEVVLQLGNAHSTDSPATVALMDAYGKIISTATTAAPEVMFNLSGLRHGVYTIQLTTAQDEVHHFKVVLMK